MANFRIKTPHAAVKIWNYVDRIEAKGTNAVLANAVQEEIVSTISCSAIQTVKAKSNPVGQFHLVLAPTRNWTAVITPGSWCVVMMSNEPITKKDFEKANPKLVKMVGKIESVRTQVTTNPDGSRSTHFLVTGQDWGHLFNNILYVDPLIMDGAENRYDQGNALFAQLVHVIQRDGTPLLTRVKDNLQTLLEVFGKPLIGIGGQIQRLGKNSHSPVMPEAMVRFFGFNSTEVMKEIGLVTGILQSPGRYSDAPDGLGWVDPFTLVGSHNLWQVLNDNSNYCLNEMFNEIVWDGDKPKLTLFNRVKPFAYRNDPIESSSIELRSMFKYVPAHALDDITIMSVNAGTNWRDKYNFIEIKPEVADFKVFENWIKQKAQAWDANGTHTFDREGFRPLIFAVKQMPYVGEGTKTQPDPDSLTKWTGLLQEWYFDTHRLLNGQVTMTGSNEYIAVGNNIMFDAGLVGVKANYNSAATNPSEKYYVLAHVECVKHIFKVDDNGSRSFQTVIDFVRGIIVDGNKNLVGEGVLDTLSTSLPLEISKNDKTVVATATPDNPGHGE